jgi:hypothetical protein
LGQEVLTAQCARKTVIYGDYAHSLLGIRNLLIAIVRSRIGQRRSLSCGPEPPTDRKPIAMKIPTNARISGTRDGLGADGGHGLGCGGP